MDTCNYNHEDVAYVEGIRCPACEVREEMESQYTELNDKYESAMKEAEDYLIERDSLVDELGEALDGLSEALAKLESFSSMEDTIKKMVEDRF